VLAQGALDDEAIAGRTAPWTFTGSHSRRKARIGIDQALGSPSVLPKEGTPGSSTGSTPSRGTRATAVSARTAGSRSSARTACLPERATGVPEARLHEVTPVNTRASLYGPAEAGDDVV